MSAARYQGVFLPKGKKSYKAAIGFQGEHHSLGSYATPAEAAVVYDEARIYLLGRFRDEEQAAMAYDQFRIHQVCRCPDVSAHHKKVCKFWVGMLSCHCM